MRTLLLFCSLLFSATSFSQTVRQLYDEYNANSAVFEKKYLNKTITAMGKVWRISAASAPSIGGQKNQHIVALTATGYETFVRCFLDFEDTATLYALRAGDVVTVTGMYSKPSGSYVDLYPCTFSKVTAPPAVKKQAPPAHVPLGKYHVYQEGGNGFAYQYAFTLNSPTSYTLNGSTGACTYNKATKVIRFTSGKLKGFVGLYRAADPDDENKPPTILLDFHNEIPDYNKSRGGKYQYAYWQK